MLVQRAQEAGSPGTASPQTENKRRERGGRGRGGRRRKGMKSFLESMVVIRLWGESQCPLLLLDETLRWVESSPD